jgi:putative phosphoesterase
LPYRRVKLGMKTVGIISDTHGLLREEAVQALEGVDLIIHAGDIGSRDVVDELEKVSPVIAVRGNCDRGKWADKYPEAETVKIGNKTILVLHDLNKLDIEPEKAGFDIVISGHSHKAKQEEKGGILYINPGSAGPRRFSLPISIAQITIDSQEIGVSFITL